LLIPKSIYQVLGNTKNSSSDKKLKQLDVLIKRAWRGLWTGESSKESEFILLNVSQPQSDGLLKKPSSLQRCFVEISWLRDRFLLTGLVE
jgi:hypothetical protein